MPSLPKGIDILVMCGLMRNVSRRIFIFILLTSTIDLRNSPRVHLTAKVLRVNCIIIVQNDQQNFILRK